MIKLKWENAPEGDISTIEEAIRKDFNSSHYSDLVDRPWSLLTHTVFLGPSMDEGPVIHMWGIEGDDHFHCRWEKDVKWVSLAEWDDD